MRTSMKLLTSSAALLSFTAAILLDGDALGAAEKGGAGDRRQIILPDRNDTLPFSDGVLVGNTLYLAGTIGVDPATGKAPEDVEQEIRLVLDGVKKTLAAAEMTMDDLVSVQVFCPDLSLYDKFNEIYRTYFTKNFPARAFIGSGPLLRNGRFEVQGIAVRR
jgi:reactive intermediate/imine deaminase